MRLRLGEMLWILDFAELNTFIMTTSIIKRNDVFYARTNAVLEWWVTICWEICYSHFLKTNRHREFYCAKWKTFFPPFESWNFHAAISNVALFLWHRMEMPIRCRHKWNGKMSWTRTTFRDSMALHSNFCRYERRNNEWNEWTTMISI